MSDIRSTQTCSALVVDDNENNRIIFREALEAVGYRVTEAHNGRLSMDILNEQTFHVLILDMEMPGATGVEVFNNLKQYAEHDNMWVIIVTANPHMVTPEIEAQAAAVMGKPIKVIEFMQFVERIRSTFEPGA